MRKTTLNLYVDLVVFAVFLLLAASGLLIRYVLPPGSGLFRTLWGMDRHDWGQLHLWIAVTLLLMLAEVVRR